MLGCTAHDAAPEHVPLPRLGDVIYAADSAFFWAPFARFGVVPEITSSITLAQRVGPLCRSKEQSMIATEQNH